MTRVHIWGASGYAAAEVIRLLSGHACVELGALESRSHAGEYLGDHFPQLRVLNRCFDEPGTVMKTARRDDLVVTAGGHGDATTIVPELLRAGVRVIDLSADYRFDRRAAYGLAEWYHDEIADATLVANPGCYPTAASLALLPLGPLSPITAIVIDAKSGISGAGRNPNVDALFAEVSGDVRAYGLKGHRHQPEIERNLRTHGIGAGIAFTPHVVPLARGMLVDAYAFTSEQLDCRSVADAYAAAYQTKPFIRIVDGDRAPSIRAVNGTNDAELRIDVKGKSVRVICAIDNLGKGAAGQAVQNLNIMLGFPEESGLHARAIVA